MSFAVVEDPGKFGGSPQSRVDCCCRPGEYPVFLLPEIEGGPGKACLRIDVLQQEVGCLQDQIGIDVFYELYIAKFLEVSSRGHREPGPSRPPRWQGPRTRKLPASCFPRIRPASTCGERSRPLLSLHCRTGRSVWLPLENLPGRRPCSRCCRLSSRRRSRYPG